MSMLESDSHYKSISNLAGQIQKYLKSTVTLENLFQTKLILLRKKLNEKCINFLLDGDVLTVQRNKIDDILWNFGFYIIIQKFRGNNSYLVSDFSLRTAYNNHLVSGITFYQNLLAKVIERFQVDNVNFTELNIPRNQARILLSENNRDPWGELGVYKCLIHLGDLYRYEQAFTGSLEQAKLHYKHALMFNPKLGNAYNQLGSMLNGINSNLDSVYFYLRCLASSEPLAISETNLKSIYEKNRNLLNKLQISLEHPINTINGNNHASHLTKKFLLGFIRLQEVFIPFQTNVKQPINMEYMCSRVLEDFEKCLQLNLFLCENSHQNDYCENIVSCIGGDPLFKICVTSIMTSQLLRVRGSTHTPTATSFALSIFSVLLQTCLRRVKMILTNFNPTENSHPTCIDSVACKMTALEFITHSRNISINGLNGNQNQPQTIVVPEYLPTSNKKPQNLSSSDDEIYDSNSAIEFPKTAKRKQRKKSDTNSNNTNFYLNKNSIQFTKKNDDGDLSEGHVSDQIISSNENSENDSEFEIIKTDCSTDDQNSEDEQINHLQKQEKSSDVNLTKTPGLLNEFIQNSPKTDVNILHGRDNCINQITNLGNSTNNVCTQNINKFTDEFTNKTKLQTNQNLESEDLNYKKYRDIWEQQTPLLKPNIFIAAKFNMLESESQLISTPVPEISHLKSATDKQIESFSHVSEIMALFCRQLQNESTLSIIRIFTVWLEQQPVILATCAQNSVLLWSHLASLLNFLPGKLDFVHHGVFPTYMESPGNLCLMKDWSKSHILYEDKLVYGFIQDSSIQNLDSIINAYEAPLEEQCLTRLICLHSFGLQMASAKIAPKFTYEGVSQKFLGPAQKQLIEEKIAEETRIQKQNQARESKSGLIKALAHQRLISEVDQLKNHEKDLRESVFPTLLLPDALCFCHQLHTLKKFISSNNFIIVIANTTLRLLDEMKSNFNARDAIRYIEREFETANSSVRPQMCQSPIHSCNKNRRKQQPRNPTMSAIKELFEVAILHSEMPTAISNSVCILFDDSIVINFLSPQTRNYDEFANLMESAAEAGVTWKTVPEFFHKWNAYNLY